MKRTKIISTIGPASDEVEILEKMIYRGMNVARLNFSHNVSEYHARIIENIRNAEKNTGISIAILQDLQGPRIRVGKLKEEVEVKKRQSVVLFSENKKYPKSVDVTSIPVQHDDLYKDVELGHRILIEDGMIQLRVVRISGVFVYCVVDIGGIIKPNKGMNFPDSKITCSALTPKDIRDIEFGIKNGVDFIALSFVRDAKDISRIRKYIYAFQKKNGIKEEFLGKPNAKGKWPGVHTRIIAKIERKEGFENFDEILEASDGIMIARGDLGIEYPLEKVPLMQKDIIAKCNVVAKPVIVATHMLDSIIKNPVPTRAEISDIANAILDGADAIMLSGETASGKYPLEAVEVMARVAKEIENSHFESHRNHAYVESRHSITEAVSQSVHNIARDVGAKLIVCSTTSGFTARNISRHKPSIPIIAVTPFEKTKKQLHLSWGVESYYSPRLSSIRKLLQIVTKIIKQNRLAQKGDKVVICAGHPFGYMGETNLIRVYTVE